MASKKTSRPPATSSPSRPKEAGSGTQRTASNTKPLRESSSQTVDTVWPSQGGGSGGSKGGSKDGSEKTK